MNWITEDWHELLPRTWAAVALVFVAVVCGGIVGIERERKQKAVGFRTLALVSLGSAVFTMIASSLGHKTPIAAQVVTGLGFLGAGVILRGPYGITGLTSAATIWAMAAVGMTVGIGYAGAGLVLSGFMLVAMLGVSLGEQRYIGRCRYRWALLTFQAAGGKTLIKIEEVLAEYRFPSGNCESVEPAPGAASSTAEPSSLPTRGQLRLRYCDVHRHHHEFLAYLANMAEVEEIRRDPFETPTPAASHPHG